ncbi:putative Fe-S oxidoreductase [Sphaerochaeta pleomorpha str. Grapes]|uniref:Putative Fe-S oxidoreductase n=1 Tax=Sphaerochaeta pleomorpha (strain ATCC BAA-1885 / DSM 22778 / Grapes) TaxID=158190 RepID=G8QUB7_SPHPG|nr:radical SAM protein [Sphaerochaeta pleomorpha]AEV28087.1 putative Fe-S oxidoreductase [Sphaerochaeta pleomorpha str. Grapes]
MNLPEYLNNSINLIIREALHASLSNAKETRFLVRSALAQKRAAKKRIQADLGGKPIPPFLIASIATSCNLHCKGCYARVNQVCSDSGKLMELSAERWGELFKEAEELGVSFILLAGGEPLTRSEVLTQAAKVKNIVFPVFTNGTMLSGKMLDLFDLHRNLVPVVSLEGERGLTDERRGEGIYTILSQAMKEMEKRGVFFGVSITVTKRNLDLVASDSFIGDLWEKGCRLVFFIEYVPVDGVTDLAPEEAERQILTLRQKILRTCYPGMILLSFPGDEKHMGGCLASGRGFFHINPYGGAEPCPFSPYSDTSLKVGSIQQALNSPFFKSIRERGLESLDHEGGCVLFEKRSEIESILKAIQG